MDDVVEERQNELLQGLEFGILCWRFAARTKGERYQKEGSSGDSSGANVQLSVRQRLVWYVMLEHDRGVFQGCNDELVVN
jgi:hypothetical protein